MNKKFYIFILVVVLMISILSIKVFHFNGTETPFLFSSYHGFVVDGNAIIRYDGGGGNIIIPKMINGIVITEIGDHVFENLGINSVVVPDTITIIGDYAFANNNIVTLNIPSSVKVLGEGAFIHNSIKSLNISPNTVIGDACFNDNNLDDKEAFFYKIENGKVDYREIVSYGGRIRGSVEIPKTKEGVDLLILGDKSFYDSGIIAITIPDTVEVINSEAISNNLLVELYLSNNIKEIAIDAFSDNYYLGEIIIDNYSNSLLNYPWGADTSDLYWLKK